MNFITTSIVLINEAVRISLLVGDEDFFDWKEKIERFLGCKDLDLALHMDKPVLTNEKGFAWTMKKSNHLSMMHVKSYINKSIQGSIPKCDKVKNYMKTIEDQFVESDKAFNKCAWAHYENERHCCST